MDAAGDNSRRPNLPGRNVAGFRRLVARHELGRPRQTRQQHLFGATTPEIEARFAVAINIMVNVLRQLQAWSHSFASLLTESCASGLPVTTSICPVCGFIL